MLVTIGFLPVTSHGKQANKVQSTLCYWEFSTHHSYSSKSYIFHPIYKKRNPPLTDKGLEQAKALGRALPKILQDLNLPSVGAIYSSPFLRCRQTSAGIASSINDNSEKNVDTDNKNNNNNNSNFLKVRVEIGLAESMNENFFRSWAVEGTDGSWGYKNKEQPVLDPSTLHPISKQPVQQTVLNWTEEPSSFATCDNEDDNNSNIIPNLLLDYEYESVTSIEAPYALHPPKFESFKMQRARMANTMKQLAELHSINETIILVSHGMCDRFFSFDVFCLNFFPIRMDDLL